MKTNIESIVRCIEGIMENNTHGYYFYEDGFAIVDLDFWEQIDSREYDKEKIDLIKENKKLKKFHKDVLIAIKDLELLLKPKDTDNEQTK